MNFLLKAFIAGIFKNLTLNSLHFTLIEDQIDYSKKPKKGFEISQNVLSKHKPRKEKYIRRNNKSFMTKACSKAIMQRTRFRNKFLKNPTDLNKVRYKKQKNCFVSLLRKEKKSALQN